VEGLVKAKLQAVQRSRKADWGFGPAGEKPVITDIGVLVMNDDKIGALYRFLDPPKEVLRFVHHIPK